MKNIIIIGLLFFAGFAYGQTAKNMAEQHKIDYLISKIEKLENAQFIRNGISYDAKAAAGHLKMKREKAGNAIKTVDDFINKVASVSSVSGKPYIIKFDSGRQVEAKKFYLESLLTDKKNAK